MCYMCLCIWEYLLCLAVLLKVMGSQVWRGEGNPEALGVIHSPSLDLGFLSSMNGLLEFRDFEGFLQI